MHLNLIFCLLLQRFGIVIGGGVFYWCLVSFLATVGWLLWTGRARLRIGGTLVFSAFVATALLSTLIAINTPDARINGLSLPSLALVLLVYVGVLTTPTGRFDGSRTLDLFVAYLRWIAAAGILQYLVQFAGIRVFAFIDWVPALRPILAEPFFNYHPVVAYGSTVLRSNGFFLLEPSIFSQILMLAVVVDVFVRRDWRFLPLYGVAYLTTYAGTGLLAFAIAAALSVVFAPRASGRLALLLLVGAILAGVASIAVPELLGGLLGRTNELNYSGSSGYARYMIQFNVLQTFAGEFRSLIGYGPGALERLQVSAAGGASTALKLMMDYGIIGLALFATYVIGTWWRRDMALVSLYLLVNYQMGGGYLVFTPFIVLATLLCRWSDPVAPPATEEYLA